MIFKEFKNEVYKQIDKQIVPKIKNKKEETGSIIELMSLPSSQSIAIKMGNVLESSINYIIDKYADTSSVRSLIEERTNRQIDSCFEKDGAVYYFEVKANLNIDTEKARAVAIKISEIEDLLLSLYPNKVIVAKALGLRYPTSKSFENVKTNILPLNSIYGYNDFFAIFDKEMKIAENEWRTLFEEIGRYILNEANS